MALVKLLFHIVLLQSSFVMVSCLGPKLTGTNVNGNYFAGSQPSPRKVSVFSTQMRSIGCTFSFNGSIDVSWYKNGAIYRGRERNSQDGTESKNFLYLINIVEGDAGIYKCVARNGNTTGDSASFNLIVIGESKPRFQDSYPPSKLVLYEGQDFDLKCKVSNFHPVRFSWGRKLGFLNFHTHTIRNSILRFIPATKSSSGAYICKASNSKDTSYKTVNVVVVSNPSWREKPREVSVAVGQPFEVAATFYSSDSGLIAWWFKGSVKLTNSVQLRKINGENNGSYYITKYKVRNAKIEDTALYSLKVSNLNDKISAEAEVFVISKPRVVIEQGRQLIVPQGESVELECEVQGYPYPNVMWKSDGAILAKNSVNSGRNSQQIKAKLIMVIPSVTTDKKYTCYAKNQYGDHQEVIDVRTAGSPSTVQPGTSGKMSSKKSDLLGVEIIIVIVACAVVVVIIGISAWIVRAKRKSADTEISAHYSRAIESLSSDRGDEDPDDPCSDSLYMTPLVRVDPPHSHFKKGAETTMSIKRQNMMPIPLKHDEQNIYADILPPGQGKRLQFEDMNLGEICGSGNFGVVVKGTLDEEGFNSKEIAVKMLKETAGLSERKMMLDELQMMKSLSPHPNVVGFLGWCITDDNVYIVEEFVPNGSLLHYLRSKRANFNSHYINLREMTQSKCDAEFILYAWQIASGMKYLSSQSVIHRDLATRNVLLGHENVCKIADFGLARAVYQNANYKKTGSGELPVRWMAPESIFNNVYSRASDVWSFGIVLWEIATLGEIPYSNIPRVEHLLTMLKSKKRMDKPSHCSDAWYDMMSSCWEEIPGKRPEFTDICNKLGRMINEDSVFLDIPRFFSNMDKENSVEEDVFDLPSEPNPSDSSDMI